MLAVGTSADKARDLIQKDEKLQGLAISCNNSQSDCVVGGRTTQLERLKGQLSSTLKAKSKFLEVPLAYHTEAMDPVLEELTKFAQGIDMKPPRMAIVSNVFGRVVQAGESVFTPEYFALHCRNTVAFDEGIQDLLQSGTDAVASRWIEFGPHPTLLPIAGSRLDRASVELLPTLRKNVSPSTTVSQALSRLYLSTTGLDWRKVFEGHSNPNLIDLPGMPFSLKEFRADYQLEPDKHGSESIPEEDIPPHTFLSKIVQRPSMANNHVSIYETSIDVLKDYILGHRVCDYALCPASVYHEMAFSAVKDYRTDNVDDMIWSLSNVRYTSPLLYLEESTVTVRTTVEPMDNSGSVHKFSVSSYSENSPSEQRTVHCEGLVKTRPRSLAAQKYARLGLALERKKLSYKSQTSSQEVFFTKAMYEKTFTRVVTYSPLYQVVQSLRINQDTDEAFAVCRLQDPENTEISAKSTILMDVLLHIAGFVANLKVDNGNVCICKEVKSAIITLELALPEELFEVHCSTLIVRDEKAIVADAYAVDSRGIFAVFKGMVFQEVKLANINQAFRSTAKKLTDFKPNSGRATPAHSTTARLPASGSIGVIPQPSSPKASDKIKSVIASTCGVKQSSLSADTSLSALGFDSLMMAELESNIISAAGAQCNLAALAECRTVGDVEQLCLPEKPGAEQNRSEKPLGDSGSDMTANHGPSVISIIADTCGADPKSVMPNAHLQALGIDSLMISELHSRLQSISESKELSSAELSECHTVADIEKLVGPA